MIFYCINALRIGLSIKTGSVWMKINLDIKISKRNLIVIICFGVIALAAGGYYFYWTRTPEYSLKQIQEAVKTHDIEKFKQHVDIDSVLSHAIDDVLIGSMDASDGNKENNVLVKGIVKLAKPILLEAAKSAVIDYVENGDVKNNETVKKKTNSDTNALAENELGKKFKTDFFHNLEFAKIGSTKKDGKIATVGIEFLNKEMNQTFVLNIKMRGLSDGSWQIIEVVNLKDFFDDIDKAQRAYYTQPPSEIKAAQIEDQEIKDTISHIIYPKVVIADNQEAQDKINQTIMEEVNKRVEQGKKIAEIKKSDKVSYYLKMKYKLHLNDGKLLSLTFDDSSYTGGAHGMFGRTGMTIDMATGKVLNWDDLYGAIDKEQKSKINQSISTQVEERKIVIFKPFKGIGNHLNFYMSENRKPVVLFQPYAIAPFSSGILEFEINMKD